MSDIDDIIMGGMVFKGGGGPKKDDDDKVKTKAKKKKYITGAHGSGSARQKAKYRQQRATRNTSTARPPQRSFFPTFGKSSFPISPR